MSTITKGHVNMKLQVKDSISSSNYNFIKVISLINCFKSELFSWIVSFYRILRGKNLHKKSRKEGKKPPQKE